MQESKQKRLQYIFAGIAVAVVALIIYGVFFYSTPNPYGDELRITNLSEYTQGKPVNQDRIDFIQHQLLTTVNKNSETEYGNHGVKDIIVRDGTFSQTFEEQVHAVTFMVDSDDLQQSYSVSYQWTEDPEVTIDGWGNSVRCPTEAQLIYEPFDCSDEFSVYTDTIDPVLDQYLPYDGPFYSIRYSKEDDKTTINIQVMSNNNSTSTRRFYQEYKAAAIKWLEEKEDINLDDYTLVYRNFSNEVVEE